MGTWTSDDDNNSCNQLSSCSKKAVEPENVRNADFSDTELQAAQDRQSPREKGNRQSTSSSAPAQGLQFRGGGPTSAAAPAELKRHMWKLGKAEAARISWVEYWLESYKLHGGRIPETAEGLWVLGCLLVRACMWGDSRSRERTTTKSRGQFLQPRAMPGVCSHQVDVEHWVGTSWLKDPPTKGSLFSACPAVLKKKKIEGPSDSK